MGDNQADAASPHDAEGGARSRERLAQSLARQEIMELRHAYAIATDLIGTNRAPDVAEGQAIYRRIFTADARIGATGIDPVSGPDAWVAVVKNALAPYQATQHLIGTQYVTGLRLPDGNGAGGRARMTSYLQAWHSKANDDLWLYMGTYADDLVYSESGGWQISSMLLQNVAADYRKLGRQPDA